MTMIIHKRSLFLTVVAMAITLIASQRAFAQSAFGGGSGTSDDPYIISTTDHMDQLASDVNNGNEYTGKCFRLVSNLDYSEKTYTPIGVSSQSSSSGYNMFCGLFDGNGHSISNVTISRSNQDCIGLFGVIAAWATIKNLTLGDGSTIEGRYCVGGIVGLSNGYYTGNECGVRGCTVSGGASISGTSEVGGIIGCAGGSIVNCISFASVSGTDRYIGGVAGALNNNYTKNNYFVGDGISGAIGTSEASVATDTDSEAQRGYALCTMTDGLSAETSSLYSISGLVRHNILYASPGQEVAVTINGIDVKFTAPADPIQLSPMHTPTWSGTGSESDPFVISSNNGLNMLAIMSTVCDYEGVYFELGNDINYLSSVIKFAPIGRHIGFRGTFDGKGRSISNMGINDSDAEYLGLFGRINGGTVRNVHLPDAYIKGKSFVGGIAGYISNGTISNCSLSLFCTISGNSYIGGIAGFVSGNTSIENCLVQAYTVRANYWGGGYITGVNQESNVYVNGRIQKVSPTFRNNYYLNSLDNVTAFGYDSDKKGEAMRGYAIQSKGDATVSLTGSTGLTYSGAIYAGSTEDVTLSVCGNTSTDEGYVMVNSYDVSASAGTLTDLGGDVWGLSMPENGGTTVTVTITQSEKKRDIAYSPWVRVEIPDQAYTGSTITPEIRVYDRKENPEVLLEQDVDYEVDHQSDIKLVGTYPITIRGIDTFGGIRIEEFHVTWTSPWQGEGTEASPYIIETTDDMNNIYENQSFVDYTGIHFRLDSDLDFSSIRYTPIGSTSNPFNGTFDGNEHIITNLRAGDRPNFLSPGSSYQGVFGVIGESGTVRDLTLSNASLYGGSYAGGIAAANKGTITGCVVDGINVKVVAYSNPGVTTTGSNAGGITGDNQGTISNCLVLDSEVSGAEAYGSIAGCNTNGVIANSYYTNSGPGAVNNADIEGSAMRGYSVSGDGVSLALAKGSTVGLMHSGTVYAANGQEIYLSFESRKGYAISGGYAASAGTLTENGHLWSLTMPESDVIISGVGEEVLVLFDDDQNEDYGNFARLVDNEEEESVSVMLKGRTLYRDNCWNTLCLPFSLSTLEGTPLEGAVVRTLESESYSRGTLTLNFSPAQDYIEAGKPYIVRWAAVNEDIIDPVFSNVKLQSHVEPLGFDDLMFCGFYIPYGLFAEDRSVLYLGDSNKLYYPKIDMTINSFRAFFILTGNIYAGDPKSDDANAICAFNLNLDDAVSTAIDEHPSQRSQSTAVYDMQGRRVSTGDTSKLPKGVYIVNGRKVVVK